MYSLVSLTDGLSWLRALWSEELDVVASVHVWLSRRTFSVVELAQGGEGVDAEPINDCL